MTSTVDIQLADYLLETELFQNNWFTLYQGRRRVDDAPVLIKLAAQHLASDPFFGQRLRHTTKQVAQLEHPNIIPIFGVEQDGELLYLVYQDVKAQTLDHLLLNNGPLTLGRTHLIAAQIASALDSAHQKSVMHGSLSAGDIFVDERNRVLVANFGESQAIFGPTLSKHPIDIISPETTAPERVYGQGPSRPSDLYALGILCYQMLAGRPPFTGSASSVLHSQGHRQPQPLNQVNPGIPIAVSEVVERMLSKGVELRYNTGLEFTRALNAASHTQKTMRRYDRLVPLVERERPKPMTFRAAFYWFTALVAVLVVAVLSAWTGYEVGIRQPVKTASPNRIIVHTTLPTEALTTTLQLDTPLDTPLRQTVRLVDDKGAAGTPQQRPNTLSDTLLPAAEAAPLLPTPRPSPTPSPTVPIITQPAVPLPTPTQDRPAAVTQLIFHNPTGFDLIIDLTGPSSVSALVPPGQHQSFVLEPGLYQYMLHTPGGKGLEPVTADFELTRGQTVEKDYYSDFN